MPQLWEQLLQTVLDDGLSAPSTGTYSSQSVPSPKTSPGTSPRDERTLPLQKHVLEPLQAASTDRLLALLKV